MFQQMQAFAQKQVNTVFHSVCLLFLFVASAVFLPLSWHTYSTSTIKYTKYLYVYFPATPSTHRSVIHIIFFTKILTISQFLSRFEEWLIFFFLVQCYALPFTSSKTHLENNRVNCILNTSPHPYLMLQFCVSVSFFSFMFRLIWFFFFFGSCPFHFRLGCHLALSSILLLTKMSLTGIYASIADTTSEQEMQKCISYARIRLIRNPAPHQPFSPTLRIIYLNVSVFVSIYEFVFVHIIHLLHINVVHI